MKNNKLLISLLLFIGFISLSVSNFKKVQLNINWVIVNKSQTILYVLPEPRLIDGTSDFEWKNKFEFSKIDTLTPENVPESGIILLTNSGKDKNIRVSSNTSQYQLNYGNGIYTIKYLPICFQKIQPNDSIILQLTSLHKFSKKEFEITFFYTHDSTLYSNKANQLKLGNEKITLNPKLGDKNIQFRMKTELYPETN
jgi:hypothetical protein